MRKVPVLINFAKAEATFALVDDGDYDRVASLSWRLSSNRHYRYATTEDAPHILMHRVVMGCVEWPSKIVDHINGNGLDNRRENLRLCTHSQNFFNKRKKKSGGTSLYKGVSFYRATNKWRAMITFKVNGEQKMVSLGLFTDESAAAVAYDNAAREYFGEFARLNFPTEGEQSAHMPAAYASGDCNALPWYVPRFPRENGVLRVDKIAEEHRKTMNPT